MASTVVHYRVEDALVCKLPRKQGVRSSRDEVKVSCEQCTAKMREAAKRMEESSPKAAKDLTEDDWGAPETKPAAVTVEVMPKTTVMNGNGHDTALKARLIRIDAEVFYLQAVIRETWTILESLGNAEDRCQNALAALRRASGAVSTHQ